MCTTTLHVYQERVAVYTCTYVHVSLSAAGGVVCELVQNDCIVDYEVVLSGPFDTIGKVFVGEERGELTECDEHLRYVNTCTRTCIKTI